MQSRPGNVGEGPVHEHAETGAVPSRVPGTGLIAVPNPWIRWQNLGTFGVHIGIFDLWDKLVAFADLVLCSGHSGHALSLAFSIVGRSTIPL